MLTSDRIAALLLGTSLAIGLVLFGLLMSASVTTFKEYERSVTVKGLAEREVESDIVIWPINFTVASNDLEALYETVDNQTGRLRSFLGKQGISVSSISHGTPQITDKSAQQYGGGPRAEFRYTAQQTVTVYSDQVMTVRAVMPSLSELGKEGIVFTGAGYQSTPEYLFTGLNEIKPAMIEQATRKAREVAIKFAADSDSSLGKIRRARQGQFSISPRDNNNPHIKKVRVVATVEYYLSD